MSPEARQYLMIRMRCLLENTLSLIAVAYDQVEVLIGEYRHALLNVTPSSLALSIRKI